MNKKRLIATGIVTVALLIGASAALAYNALWSGTASVTVQSLEPAESASELLPLTIDGHVVSKGVIQNGVWKVTLQREEEATLHMYANNPRDTEAWVELYTNGSLTSQQTVATGVTVRQRIGHGAISSLVPHSNLILEFTIAVDATAEDGVLPSIQFEVREK